MGRGDPRASDLRSEVMEMEMFAAEEEQVLGEWKESESKRTREAAACSPGEGVTVGADGGAEGTPSGFQRDTTGYRFRGRAHEPTV